MDLNVIRATHPGVVFGQPYILRTQQTLEKQLRACVPFVLDGHVGGILQAEGVWQKNNAIILVHWRSLVRLVYPRISRYVCA